MKVFFRHKNKLFFFFLTLFLLLFFIFSPKLFREHYFVDASLNSQNKDKTEIVEDKPAYISTPMPLKGLYMTSWVASSVKLRNTLVKIIEETELNTVVIDIKDYTGKIVFPVSNPELKKYGSEEVRVRDMRDFIKSLHQKNIYVIGRIAVFQDAYFVSYRPDLAVKNGDGPIVWKDRKGLSWIDPASEEYWNYIILLAEESHQIGFDEINFDYIRFPSDGNMEYIFYPFSSTTPKTKIMKNFFSYLKNNLKDMSEEGKNSNTQMKISADLFGMTTVAKDDMGIGQVLGDALPYFDYVMPMVYPSHYPSSFQGYKNPEAYPYEVVKYAMEGAILKAKEIDTTASSTISNSPDYKERLRPWLQDFGLKMTYGPDQIKAQIKAIYDIGLSSWVLWSPSNQYTKGALEN